MDRLREEETGMKKQQSARSPSLSLSSFTKGNKADAAAEQWRRTVAITARVRVKRSAAGDATADGREGLSAARNCELALVARIGLDLDWILVRS